MKTSGGFYGWKLLAVFWVILFANCGFSMTCGSIASPYMAADLHFSRSTLGFAFGVFQWVTGLPGPLVALCVNRKGVRFTLLLGSLLLVAGSILMALFVRTGTEVVIAFGFVIGFGLYHGWCANHPAGHCEVVCESQGVRHFSVLYRRIHRRFHRGARADGAH